MNKPTFCAVLPNYNDAHVIEQAIGALLGQTVPFDEIIVVNDGSTDHSAALLKTIAARAPTLRVIENEKNLGIMASVNIGLNAATAEYIFFASANDRFDLRMVELAHASLREQSEVGLIGGDIQLVDAISLRTQDRSAPLEPEAKHYGPDAYLRMIRQRNFSFYGGAVFVCRKKALTLGGFREEMQWHSDWLLMALLATRYGFTYIPHVFGYITVSAQQYSQNIHVWSKQGPLLIEFLALMKRDFPEDYRTFRSIGLLPSYDVRLLLKLLRSPDLREYLTPLLCWRLVSYKPARVIGRLLSGPMRERLRKYFRV